MPWWCTNCARRFQGPRCKCGSEIAERIPPLDGFIELTPEGYDLTPEEELANRLASQDKKRRKYEWPDQETITAS